MHFSLSVVRFKMLIPEWHLNSRLLAAVNCKPAWALSSWEPPVSLLAFFALPENRRCLLLHCACQQLQALEVKVCSASASTKALKCSILGWVCFPKALVNASQGVSCTLLPLVVIANVAAASEQVMAQKVLEVQSRGGWRREKGK